MATESALRRSRVEVELVASRMAAEDVIRRSRVEADIATESALRRSRIEAEIESSRLRRFYYPYILFNIIHPFLSIKRSAFLPLSLSSFLTSRTSCT